MQSISGKKSKPKVSTGTFMMPNSNPGYGRNLSAQSAASNNARPVPLPPSRNNKPRPTVNKQETNAFAKGMSRQSAQPIPGAPSRPNDASMWTAGTDKKTGKTYYYNKNTDKSQWHKPDCLKGTKGEPGSCGS